MSSKITRRRAFGDVRNQRILTQLSANKKSHQQPSVTDIKQPQSASSSKSDEKPLLVKNENDVTKDSYDPRLETHPMDDALFSKISKLELADDGIPTFSNLEAEPFDF